MNSHTACEFPNSHVLKDKASGTVSEQESMRGSRLPVCLWDWELHASVWNCVCVFVIWWAVVYFHITQCLVCNVKSRAATNQLSYPYIPGCYIQMPPDCKPIITTSLGKMVLIVAKLLTVFYLSFQIPQKAASLKAAHWLHDCASV